MSIISSFVAESDSDSIGGRFILSILFGTVAFTVLTYHALYLKKITVNGDQISIEMLFINRQYLFYFSDISFYELFLGSEKILGDYKSIIFKTGDKLFSISSYEFANFDEILNCFEQKLTPGPVDKWKIYLRKINVIVIAVLTTMLFSIVLLLLGMMGKVN